MSAMPHRCGTLILVVAFIPMTASLQCEEFQVPNSLHTTCTDCLGADSRSTVYDYLLEKNNCINLECYKKYYEKYISRRYHPFFRDHPGCGTLYYFNVRCNISKILNIRNSSINGSINSSSFIGDAYTVMCKQGTKFLNGNLFFVAVCNVDGNWTLESGGNITSLECIQEDVKCNISEILSISNSFINGSVNSSSTVGSSYILRCEEDRTFLDGNSSVVLTCNSDGKWTSNAIGRITSLKCIKKAFPQGTNYQTILIVCIIAGAILIVLVFLCVCRREMKYFQHAGGRGVMKCFQCAGGRGDVEIPLIGKPGQPTDLHVEILPTDDPSVTLKWGPPSDDGGDSVLYYVIEYCCCGNSAWIQANDTDVTDLNFIVPRLEKGKDYQFRVMAKTSKGVGPPSDIASVFIPYSKPGQPTDLRVEILPTDDPSVTLEWGPPSDDGGDSVLYYVIEYCCCGNSAWIQANDTDVTDLNFIVPRLEKGKNYQFRVSAKNHEGIGNPSLTADIQVPFSKPGQPTDLCVEITDDSCVTLKWGPPSDDGGDPKLSYVIEYCCCVGSAWTQANDTDVKDLHFIVPRFGEGKDYMFKVTARNCKGYGPSSSGVKFPANCGEKHSDNLDLEDPLKDCHDLNFKSL